MRITDFPGGDQTVSLQRIVDRVTGSYRTRITASGRSPHVMQWDGSCEALAKPPTEATA
jgi:hypothetical protein